MVGSIPVYIALLLTILQKTRTPPPSASLPPTTSRCTTSTRLHSSFSRMHQVSRWEQAANTWTPSQAHRATELAVVPVPRLHLQATMSTPSLAQVGIREHPRRLLGALRRIRIPSRGRRGISRTRRQPQRSRRLYRLYASCILFLGGVLLI